MAKLHSYFVLCPLIDQKSFLGVVPDKENNIVIVTLGRNVVNKYRLTDQKQTGGWTSKEQLTTAVIYDPVNCRYVGVFNHNTIRLWSDDVDNLDKEKLKKYKFSVSILKLQPRQNLSPLVIFTNGCCFALQYAIDNRKAVEMKSILKAGEVLTDISTFIMNDSEHICMIVKNRNKYELLLATLKVDSGELERSKLFRVKIFKENCEVAGKLIASEPPTLYILWSDSKLQLYDIINKSWRIVGSVPWVSTSLSVSMAWMGESHLIVFGSDLNEDGAIIVAYNVNLGVGSYRYPMKIYTQDAKLYCYYDNIILEASNHLGILPYALEATRSLASLLGTCFADEDDAVNICDTRIKSIGDKSNELEDMVMKGLSERSICHSILPKFIENNDKEHLQQMIEIFDVPEHDIVTLIKYALKTELQEIDLDKRENLTNCIKNKDLSFLKKLFQISFSDALLVPILKNSLTLNEALLILNYISYLLGNESEDTFNIDYERKLLDWFSVLIDSFYQQFILTKDEATTTILEKVRYNVSFLLEDLDEVNNLLPLLNALISNKTDNEEPSNSYVIEVMKI